MTITAEEAKKMAESAEPAEAEMEKIFTSIYSVSSRGGDYITLSEGDFTKSVWNKVIKRLQSLGYKVSYSEILRRYYVRWQ